MRGLPPPTLAEKNSLPEFLVGLREQVAVWRTL